ncbi:MAG: thioredoxin family protein [Candidatus Obscuribacterales bacterium]|nr:thioredoxin family protein [Candidatus Obscuribacterales bacterium]
MSIQALERGFENTSAVLEKANESLRDEVISQLMIGADNPGSRLPSPFTPRENAPPAAESGTEARLDSTNRTAPAEKKIEWAENLSDAFRKAQSENKPMVLMFGADWCTACTKLKDTVVNSKEFNAYGDRAVFVHANPDKDDRFGNIKQKMQELGIDSFPTMVILEVPSMVERARVTGRWDKEIYMHKVGEAFKGKSDAPMPRSSSTPLAAPAPADRPLAPSI